MYVCGFEKNRQNMLTFEAMWKSERDFRAEVMPNDIADLSTLVAEHFKVQGIVDLKCVCMGSVGN